MTVNTHYLFNEVVEIDTDDLIIGSCIELPDVVHSSPERSENRDIILELLRDTIPKNFDLEKRNLTKDKFTTSRSRCLKHFYPPPLSF